MKIFHEVEGAAYPQADIEAQVDARRHPSSGITSKGRASSTCRTDFPMLTPHEIATLMLIAHTPGEVTIEWLDLPPLVTGNLVQVDKCQSCRGTPHVTPLGESLVVRIRKAKRSHTGRHLGG